MTEAEWTVCQSSVGMFNYLGDSRILSKRKRQLFDVAVCRRAWHLLTDPRSREAVEIIEQHADGLVSDTALLAAQHQAAAASSAAEMVSVEAYRDALATPAHRLTMQAIWEAASSAAMRIPSNYAISAVGHAAAASARAGIAEDYPFSAEMAEEAAHAALLRDLLGPLPFRDLRVPTSVLAWNDGCVVKLATAIYAGRDFTADRLAVLADALEEAGVMNEDMLTHCRQEGTVHFRGCWLVDLLLDKA